MTTPLQQQPVSQPLVEGVSTLYGISWEQFKTIDATLDESKGVKLSYLHGVLEIMSPIGPEHERVKSTLGVLLEAYMREKGIRFYRCGGFTIESPETASGTPDESYAIGTPKKIPDIVIEVIITSGRLDKKSFTDPGTCRKCGSGKRVKLPCFTWENRGMNRETVVNSSPT